MQLQQLQLIAASSVGVGAGFSENFKLMAKHTYYFIHL